MNSGFSFFVLLLLPLNPVVENPVPSFEDSVGGKPCSCCRIECELPPQEEARHEKEPGQQDNQELLVKEINEIYKTQDWTKPSRRQIRVEQNLLDIKGFFRCQVCERVVGPGVDHPFRHPWSIEWAGVPRDDCED